MRFHMGISFRLKTLKRFLLPFLIGVLAYFGISSFNIMQVHAYNSTSTFYNFEYTEIDFDDIQTDGDYSFKDILDLSTIPSDYYYVYTFIERSGGDNTPKVYTLRYFLFDKTLTETYIDIYGRSTTNMGITNNYVNFIFNPSRYFTYYQPLFTLSSSMTTEGFETNRQKLYSCLVDNDCTNNFSSTTDTWSSSLNKLPTINNGSSYNFDLGVLLMDNTAYNRVMPYYTNIPVKYTTYTSTGNTTYFRKLIEFNGTQIETLDPIKTYCDFYDCTSGGTEWITGIVDTPTFNIGGISPSDITSLNIELHMSLLSGNIDSDNPFPYLYNFYGRKDNTTYYSYEKIDCFMGQMYGIGTDNVYNYYVNNVSCTTDLTPYDNIYINIYPYGYFTANDIQFTTNYGWTYTSPLLHHYSILEKFNNLPSDINILLSTTDYITSAHYVTDNEYMFNALVNRDTNKISSVVGNKYQQFGTYDNTSLMIYNLKSVNDNTTSELYIFFQQDTILSVGDNGTFTYYDSSNTITDGNIVNNYQAYTDESYNLSYYFNQVNDFLDDLDADLLSVHDIFQNIYNSIPNFFQVCITVFYILLLTYLLFRFIRS